MKYLIKFKISQLRGVMLAFGCFLSTFAVAQVDSSAFYSNNQPVSTSTSTFTNNCQFIPNNNIAGSAHSSDYWQGLGWFTEGSDDNVPDWTWVSHSPNFSLPGVVGQSSYDGVAVKNFIFRSFENNTLGTLASGCLNMGTFFDPSAIGTNPPRLANRLVEEGVWNPNVTLPNHNTNDWYFFALREQHYRSTFSNATQVSLQAYLFNQEANYNYENRSPLRRVELWSEVLSAATTTSNANVLSVLPNAVFLVNTNTITTGVWGRVGHTFQISDPNFVTNGLCIIPTGLQPNTFTASEANGAFVNIDNIELIRDNFPANQTVQATCTGSFTPNDYCMLSGVVMRYVLSNPNNQVVRSYSVVHNIDGTISVDGVLGANLPVLQFQVSGLYTLTRSIEEYDGLTSNQLFIPANKTKLYVNVAVASNTPPTITQEPNCAVNVVLTAHGQPDYTYEWSNNTTGATTTVTTGGIYTVTATPASGCITTATTFVQYGNFPAVGSATVGVDNVGAWLHPNGWYVWNPDHLPIIKGDIIIPDNTKLVIEDITVNMPQGSKIVVNHSTLIINRSKITSCSTWKGIEIINQADVNMWGNIVMEDVMVENAEIGIVLGTNEYGSGSGEGYGNIACYHTTFKNNKHDIWLAWDKFNSNDEHYVLPWEFGILSDVVADETRYFNRCLFVTDNAYKFSTTNEIPAHIVNIHNNGLKIVYSDFINENTTLAYQGAGVVSLFGSYQLTEGLFDNEPPAGSTTYQRSTNSLVPTPQYGHFKGLEYGVYSIAELLDAAPSPVVQPCIVKYQKFEDCINGAYLGGFEGEDAVQVKYNKFTNCKQYGAYLETVSSFQMQENTCKNTPFGLIANKTSMNDNTSGYANQIYNNTFEDCEVGALAMGKNYGNDAGLEFRCNQFDGTTFTDMWVYGYDENGDWLPDAGVKKQQGNPNATTSAETANNKFSTSATEFLLWSAQSIEYTHTSDAVYTPDMLRVNRLGGGTFAPHATQFPFNGDIACLEESPAKIQTIAEGWQIRTAALTEKGILENSLNTLKDGGNTPLLKNEVAMTQLQNAYVLYAKLLAKSPYVSEEVLQALAEKENFPKALARDILVANKHAGKDGKVWEKLDERTDQLPEYMLAQIQQAAESGLSGKEYLELAINAQSARYHNAIQGQIALLDADNTATVADYEAVITGANGLGYQMRLVKKHAADGNTAAANAALLDIPNHVTMSVVEAANYADYVTIFPIETRLKTQPIEGLTSAELQTLTALAGNKNAAQVKARALTEAATHTRNYQEALPIIAQERSSVRKPRLKNAYNKVGDDVPNFINIFPNPANDYIKIETTNPQSGIFSLYNAQGSLVKTINTATISTISLIDLPSGAYFYEYSADGIVIKRDKLQIVR